MSRERSAVASALQCGPAEALQALAAELARLLDSGATPAPVKVSAAWALLAALREMSAQPAVDSIDEIAQKRARRLA